MSENSLGINTALFGNDSDKFFLEDPALYLDFHDGNGQVGMGYLEAEKTWRQTAEYASFSTGIPKSQVRRDMITQEFMIEAIMKQFQKETLALTAQRMVDLTDGSWDRVIMGEAVPVPVFPSCVLISTTVDGEEIRLYIRKLQITAEDLEIILGGDDYSSIPFKGTALIDTDPLVTNPTWPYNAARETQDNIAFWAFPKEVSSSV